MLPDKLVVSINLFKFSLDCTKLLLKDYNDVIIMKCLVCLLILTKYDRTLKGKRWLGISRCSQRWIFMAFELFIYLWLCWVFVAVRGLFSSCGERGLLFIVVCRLFIAVASRCGAWALGARASVVVARRLSSCGSWAQERRLNSCGAQA